MDPLLVLRKCLKSGEEISLHDNSGNAVKELSQSVFLKFSKLIYPRDIPTNFRSKRGAGDFYPLDAVWFMLQCRESSFGEYMQEARRMGVMAVSLVDRKELLAYLEEDVRPEECPYVDTAAVLPMPRRTFGQGEEPPLEEEEEEEAKMGDGRDMSRSLAPTEVGRQVTKSRPVRSREASLLASSKDFTNVMEAAKDLLKSLTASEASSAPVATNKPPQSLIEQIASANKPVPERTSSSRSSSTSSPKPIVPIIIVPAASSATLTMYNCLRFLDKGQFTTTSEAKSHSRGKENMLSFDHKFGPASRTIRFQIVDNPARLVKDDWSRVVAVFVQGSLWQFKGWKWESPVELFQNVLGFSLQFDDAQVDSNVASWKVHRLTISRSHRHLDATAVFQFWARIEDHLKARRMLQ